MRELWLRQIRGVLGLELRKTMLSGRAIPVYLLALFPVAMMALFFIVAMIAGDLPSLQEGVLIYAGVFQAILRGFLYLGCVWTFMNLFRGEVLDRSLHYYFLSPIRREVLAIGKFVSGWVGTSILFATSTAASLLLFYASFGMSTFKDYVFNGPGFGQMVSYVGVALMACLGYGAVFLVVGLFFRNPIPPAVMIWFWEFLNPFMPALLKKVSVIFYLNSLLPVELPPSPFSVVAEPTPVWLALPGFLLFSAATLVVAGLRIRRMEIAYSTD